MGLIEVKPGMRWDEVSTLAYGSPMYAWEIIAENMAVLRPVSDFVRSAATLTAPDLATFSTAASELPPWRRNA